MSMPKLVDIDERRSALIDATSREIAQRGLAKVTLRSIARVNGWSTGIVTHYFTDKHELLMATFQERADRSRRQIELAVAGGATLLDAAVDAALPLDDERLTDWRVYLAYMGAAVGEPDLGRLLRDRQERFADTLAVAIDDGVAGRRFAAGLDARHEAARLMVVLNGVAIQAVLAPDLWSPPAQRRIVDDHLRTLGRRR
jgi:AcrR family transcriptional regulator